jgi:hypothetical protein
MSRKRTSVRVQRRTERRRRRRLFNDWLRDDSDQRFWQIDSATFGPKNVG